ncbi:hypothetical protein [Treponema sp.]|uniref:hypothetical protein n=1 Tax=Treponema sp. TaxID=166 RepID=UPI0025F21A2F|nr:hypothetical protein [Treponema sp.]MCR5217324.1 hypothetical protein [Treponema sp.]
MTEEKELTQIERELVLQYLRDDNVPLTITLEEKPLQKETDVTNDRIDSVEDEQRIPASAVFPVAIKSRQIEVLNQGIILLKNAGRLVQPFIGKNVRVQFYFNHVGLYFISVVKEYSMGFAVVIPPSIKRVKDSFRKNDFEISATLSFDSVSQSCLPLAGFNLFSQPKWSEIEIDQQHHAKELLEHFIAMGKQSAVILGNGLHLISIVHYLTRTSQLSSESIEGLVKPLDIIYVDDKRFVCASDTQDELEENQKYTLEMNFMISPEGSARRAVKVPCTVEKTYTDSQLPSRKCWSCRYDNLQTEDMRFLYERISGKKFAG